ncbi:MAG: DNA recombination protein RmuC [Elusimicrobia bacterium]|nr:DNA recombination protein RmuC [Elusimicrobiota bacterium]
MAPWTTVTLVAIAVAAIAALLYALRSKSASEPLLLLQQQIDALRQQSAESAQTQTDALTDRLIKMGAEVNRQLEAVGQRVQESQKSVGDRLDSATRVVGEVQKSLGALGQASDRIFEIGKDISSLQDILKAPKLRGGLGEFFLADLLSQILPAQNVEFQHTFKTRETVDAVIRLGGRLVSVDAKFPLENFRKMLEAGSDEDRRTLRKKFAQDMRKHVDAVASKYILPDEGTFDFALLYIPAENVYYECIVKDDPEEGALMEYALRRRVVPVSPGSFYAYLQVIALGLRGFQIEENARRIMEDLGRLRGDLERFAEEFDLLGRHLSNAKTKHDDASRRLERFQDKLSTIANTAVPLTSSAEIPSLPSKS